MTFKTAWFISDLHLSENCPEISQQFFEFLKKLSPASDRLYILGDLFEAYIGDDDQNAFLQSVWRELKAACEKGVSIDVLYGNRDFLMRNKFFLETGCKFMGEEEKINLHGKTILVMHGDTLCSDDAAYLRMRKIFRHRLIQWLFLQLPLSVRKKIGETLRNKSRRYTQNTPLALMDVNQETVKKTMQKHSVNYLIHGHTHRPGKHDFLIDTTLCCRMVLGAWHDGANALRCDGTGEIEFVLL